MHSSMIRRLDMSVVPEIVTIYIEPSGDQCWAYRAFWVKQVLCNLTSRERASPTARSVNADMFEISCLVAQGGLGALRNLACEAVPGWARIHTSMSSVVF